jgi:hypothetical protein
MRGKRQESERQRMELEGARQVRDKEAQVEMLKGQIASYQLQQVQGQEEARMMQNQIKEF